MLAPQRLQSLCTDQMNPQLLTRVAKTRWPSSGPPFTGKLRGLKKTQT
jgi:hypothetical protein